MKINKITFHTSAEYSHLNNDMIVVVDHDCCMEKTFKLGLVQELEDYEPTLIESFDQVKKAYKSGRAWF